MGFIPVNIHVINLNLAIGDDIHSRIIISLEYKLFFGRYGYFLELIADTDQFGTGQG